MDSPGRTPSAAEMDMLYDRNAKPLEAEHYGEFIAISRTSGPYVLGRLATDVLSQAKARLGRGNAVFQIGARIVARLESPRPAAVLVTHFRAT